MQMFKVFGREFENVDKVLETLKITKKDLVGYARDAGFSGKPKLSEITESYLRAGCPIRNKVEVYWNFYGSMLEACRALKMDFGRFSLFMLGRGYDSLEEYKYCEGLGSYIECYHENLKGVRKYLVVYRGIEYANLSRACEAAGLTRGQYAKVREVYEHEVISYEDAIDRVKSELNVIRMTFPIRVVEPKEEVTEVELSSTDIKDICEKMGIRYKTFLGFRDSVLSDLKKLDKRVYDDDEILKELYLRLHPEFSNGTRALSGVGSYRFSGYEKFEIPLCFRSMGREDCLSVLGVEFGSIDEIIEEFGISENKQDYVRSELERYVGVIPVPSVCDRVGEIVLGCFGEFSGELGCEATYVLMRRRYANVGKRSKLEYIYYKNKKCEIDKAGMEMILMLRRKGDMCIGFLSALKLAYLEVAEKYNLRINELGLEGVEQSGLVR